MYTHTHTVLFETGYLASSRAACAYRPEHGLFDLRFLFSACFLFCVCNRPGPSSPLPWMRDCVLQLAPQNQWRHKILLGLNLYGLDFTVNGGAEPLLGGRYGVNTCVFVCVRHFVCESLFLPWSLVGTLSF